jgi:CheY-like chemotaxis protein
MAKLLVVDDDPQMLASLSDVLQSSGYEVACANSSSEALTRVLAAPGAFELVVTDVRMTGMDGLDCLYQMRQSNPDLKSIVITGYASEDAPGKAMDLATSDYLRKPFTADDLLQSVARALGAGKEATGYVALLQKAKLAAQKVGAALSGLEALREQVFQWYYIGIRAGHFGPGAARFIWQWLESAEWERLRAEKDLSLLSKVNDLKEIYEKVGYFCKNPSAAVATEGEPLLKRTEFQPFFGNIQSGEISPEQLKLAVSLRSMAPDELKQHPELLELKKKIWAELRL